MAQEPEGLDLVKINKIKILWDLIIKWKLNSIHITETHNDNLVALGLLAGWHATPRRQTWNHNGHTNPSRKLHGRYKCSSYSHHMGISTYIANNGILPK
jgi:hypothetical protein